MERESLDEDEDRLNLIDPDRVDSKHERSSFEINGFFSSSNIGRGFTSFHRLGSNKRYLFPIFLLLFILLVLYFFTGYSTFGTDASCKFDSPSTRMRESELRALYLLRQQQLGVLTILNRTSSASLESLNCPSVNSTSNFSSSLTPPSLLDGVKSALQRQILLNNQIQKLILSSHQLGNLSSDLIGDPNFGGYGGLDECRKVDLRISERRTMDWRPKANKYLFAICLSGQMSNHLICLEKHMFFAAILNRVLVIPSSKVDYQYNRVLDIDHINQCLGRKVVISFEEFYETKKHHLHIDRFICYFSLPTPCFVDEDHIKKLKALGISFGKINPAWVEDTKNPIERMVKDVEAKFSSDDDVIAIGDVFYAKVEEEWVMQPGGPLAHKCKTLIEPSRLIMVTAQRFIQTFLGKNFIALHFRRHGFLKFCNAKRPSCFFPVPQAADCISQVVQRANVPVIYLSTDAAESETDLLQSLVVVNGKAVPLVKRPARNSAEKWDALLYRHGLEGDSQVEAMLDKTICAMANVFIGSSGSTFTEDILRLRKDWGSASNCDEYLCQGEPPNFIAEDE